MLLLDSERWCVLVDHADGEWRLLLISQRTPVGRTYDGMHTIYRIDKVVALSVAADDASELELDVSSSMCGTEMRRLSVRVPNTYQHTKTSRQTNKLTNKLFFLLKSLFH